MSNEKILKVVANFTIKNVRSAELWCLDVSYCFSFFSTVSIQKVLIRLQGNFPLHYRLGLLVAYRSLLNWIRPVCLANSYY